MQEDNGQKTIEYKDHVIKLVPYEELDSKFSVVILNYLGKEVKKSSRAGESEEQAFEYGKRLVDFEIQSAKYST
ncbi:MAG TPA: hypothetical protein VKN82_04900 [Desulfohalobiaceae bacterium]|nr:hypothetical protein [Desulfohalobiaceae bacterium]